MQSSQENGLFFLLCFLYFPRSFKGATVNFCPSLPTLPNAFLNFNFNFFIFCTRHEWSVTEVVDRRAKVKFWFRNDGLWGWTPPSLELFSLRWAGGGVKGDHLTEPTQSSVPLLKPSICPPPNAIPTPHSICSLIYEAQPLKSEGSPRALSWPASVFEMNVIFACMSPSLRWFPRHRIWSWLGKPIHHPNRCSSCPFRFQLYGWQAACAHALAHTLL